MRVVIDTNVIVSGLRSTKGAAFQVLRGIQNKRITPIVTVPVFLEYEDVLLRPGLLPAPMSAAAISAFLDAFLIFAEHREVYFNWRPWVPDPKDECILEAAVAGGCVPIITHNLRDFHPATPLGVAVMTPAELVTQLKLQ